MICAVRITAIVVLLVVTLCPALASTAREEQWLFRPGSAGENQHDLAIFLSWDYSAVLFRAWCEPPRQLVIQYFGDRATRMRATDRVGLWLNDNRYLLPTKLLADPVTLEGRLPITEQFQRQARTASNIDIDAPNEMGEPWYTGAALPLKRIISECS